MPSSSSSSPRNTDSSPAPSDVTDHQADKYLVFREQLGELLRFCSRCGSAIVGRREFATGSMLSVEVQCHAGCEYTWRSQPVVRKNPLGNALLSAAILFTGLTYTAVAELATCLGLLFCTRPVFDRHQRDTLLPVIQEAWNLEREGASLEVREGGPVTFAGDARCDTPGHNAKYGS